MRKKPEAAAPPAPDAESARPEEAQPLRAVKLRPPRLKPGMTAGKALEITLHGTLRHLSLNVAAVLDNCAPEAIHQARVAERRTRAALGAYRPILDRTEAGRIGREFKWLHGRLGAVRDLDVFLMDTLTPLIEGNPREKSLKRLEKVARDARAEACKAATQALRSARFDRLAARAGRLADGGWYAGAARDPDESVTAFGARALDKAENRLGKAVRAAGDDTRALHRARIEAKKLHYAAQFFDGAFPGRKASRFIGVVSGLQDALGLAQDTVAGQVLAAALARKQGARLDRAAGIVAGYQMCRAMRAREARETAWRTYAEAPRFWKAD